MSHFKAVVPLVRVADPDHPAIDLHRAVEPHTAAVDGLRDPLLSYPVGQAESALAGIEVADVGLSGIIDENRVPIRISHAGELVHHLDLPVPAFADTVLDVQRRVVMRIRDVRVAVLVQRDAGGIANTGAGSW